jgi:hypoxanthine phosphoribosyltransferase
MKKRAPAKSNKRLAAKLKAARTGARLKVLKTDKEISKRVRAMAKQIDKDYAGKTLHVVGILENCFVFMADLVRALTIPVICTFVRSQMIDCDSDHGPIREITYIPHIEAAGKDLLLVEGVLHSGITLDHLCQTLMTQRPSSLRTATLLDKTDERRVDVPVDYSGFQLSGPFVVGYGLGYEHQYRNLPYLARIV